MKLVRAILIMLVPAAPAIARDVDAALLRLKQAAPHVGVTRTGGRVTQLYGTALTVAATPDAAREGFLRDHAALLGVTPDRLRLEATVRLPNRPLTLFAYRQHIEGTPVVGRWIKLLVRTDRGASVVKVTSSAHPGTPNRRTPALDARQAIAAARSLHPDVVNAEPPGLVYYPLSDNRLNLAWRFFADNGLQRGFERWNYVVDATDGTVLARTPGIMHLDISGRVHGFRTEGAYPHTNDNPPANLPVYGAAVHLGPLTAYTDEAGMFHLTTDEKDEVTLTVDLLGRFATVINNGDGGLVGGSESVVPPGPADFLLNATADEFTTAQLNAAHHVHRVHEFVKSLSDPMFDGFDISMAVFVNRDEHCNAFYTLGAPSLNFFRAGDGCPNTAYETVIYHEYGHFIVEATPGGEGEAGVDAADYHEGMADALAALLTDDPCMAPDFRGEGAGCLRNAAAARPEYPCYGDSHECGRVISGAFWDLRNELIATEGAQRALDLTRELYMGQLFTGVHRIDPQVTVDVLTLDDDNSELADGTPHYDEICTAFAARGLNCPPPLRIEFADARPDLIAPGVRHRIDLEVLPNGGAPAAGTAIVHYRYDDGNYVALPMAETSPHTYAVELPAGMCGQTLEYYVTADSQTHGLVTVPPYAPQNPFLAVIGDDTETLATYDFETDVGWRVVNSPALIDGAWETGVPVGRGDRGDPATDFDGSGSCFLTDNEDGNSDVDALDDSGSTTLVSPVFDVRGLNHPRLTYARWYSTIEGNGPFVDVLRIEATTDGRRWGPLETVGPDGREVLGGWFVRDFRIADVIGRDGPRFGVRFRATDVGEGSIVEAAVDAFSIYDVLCDSECTRNLECDDGDPCTFDACGGGSCQSIRASYGDIAAPGECGPDGELDALDIVAVLDAFSGIATDGCDPSGADIASGSGCGRDGKIDIYDIFGVLSAFLGDDPCCTGP